MSKYFDLINSTSNVVGASCIGETFYNSFFHVLYASNFTTLKNQIISTNIPNGTFGIAAITSASPSYISKQLIYLFFKGNSTNYLLVEFGNNNANLIFYRDGSPTTTSLI